MAPVVLCLSVNLLIFLFFASLFGSHIISSPPYTLFYALPLLHLFLVGAISVITHFRLNIYPFSPHLYYLVFCIVIFPLIFLADGAF